MYARLRQKGMGGAGLRAIEGLMQNTARLSVGGGVGYTEPVRREGYVLSPFLFSLALTELIEELESHGAGCESAASGAARPRSSTTSRCSRARSTRRWRSVCQRPPSPSSARR